MKFERALSCVHTLDCAILSATLLREFILDLVEHGFSNPHPLHFQEVEADAGKSGSKASINKQSDTRPIMKNVNLSSLFELDTFRLLYVGTELQMTVYGPISFQDFLR